MEINRLMKMRFKRKHLTSVVLLVALLIPYVACGFDPPKGALTPAPKSKPKIPPSHWLGFQGAGPLHGVATQCPQTPLKRRWVYKSEGAFLGGAMVADKVYVGDSKGILHSIDLQTGKQQWSYMATADITVTPLLANIDLRPVILFGDEDGLFHCVDGTSGKKVWTFQTEGQIHSSANYQENRVLFGSDDNFLYCLDLNKGKLLWRFETNNFVYCPPAILGNLAFIAGCDGDLVAIDLTTGKAAWRRNLGRHAAAAPLPGKAPTGVKYVLGATLSGELFRFGGTEWKQEWLFAMPEATFFASPATFAEVVVIGSQDDQTVYGVDLNSGKKKWDFLTRGAIDGAPVITTDGRVVVASGDGKLYFLDLYTGKKLWAFAAGRGISATPAVCRGVVIIGDKGGTLYCLE